MREDDNFSTSRDLTIKKQLLSWICKFGVIILTNQERGEGNRKEQEEKAEQLRLQHVREQQIRFFFLKIYLVNNFFDYENEYLP